MKKLREFFQNRYVKRTGVIVITVLSVIILLRLVSPSLKSDVSFSQAIYDRNGKLLRLTLSRDEKYRLWLPLKAISPVLVNATLLHEDKWFRFHPGVSPPSLFRAVWHTYIKKDRKIGGSTITMQLARIRYDINSRTISGKTKQILAALRLELLYSKNEILEAYLNLVPYGLNIEGAGAASLIYFSQERRQTHPRRRAHPERDPPESCTPHGVPEEDGIAANPNLEQARKILFAKWVAKNPNDMDQKSLIELPVLLKTLRTCRSLRPIL